MSTIQLPNTLVTRKVGTSTSRRQLAVGKSAVATARAAFPQRIFTPQEVYVELMAQIQRPENTYIEGTQSISAYSINIRLAEYAWNHPRELLALPGERYMWKQEEEEHEILPRI